MHGLVSNEIYLGDGQREKLQLGVKCAGWNSQGRVVLRYSEVAPGVHIKIKATRAASVAGEKTQIRLQPQDTRWHVGMKSGRDINKGENPGAGKRG